MTPAEFKAARKALGWSARQMAEALGISGGRVIRGWEAGEYKVSGPVERLVRLWLAQPATRPKAG
jgi:DNA-binding transcriptional regulator YiaG